jgi:RNA polymerase sigma-70 factor, ECF subfamily
MQMDAETRAQFEWITLRCQPGDAGAFEELIAVVERPLLYYAMSLTGSEDSALDVLEQVWIKALGGIRKLKDPGRVRSWLYSITHGIAVDRVRRNVSRERAE